MQIFSMIMKKKNSGTTKRTLKKEKKEYEKKH